MAGLTDLFKEVHRRSMWQVLGTYVAVAWITLQVIEVLMGTVGLPGWVPRFAIGILAAGLPLVLMTAFVQEGLGRRAAARTASDSGGAAEASTDTREGPETDAAARGAAPAPATRSGGATRRLFTWRNAAVAGVTAFALLGLATAGYMAMRSLGIGPVGSLIARGVIEQGEQVVLADFAGEPEISEVATIAFRVDLAQSPSVSAAEPSYVAAVLERMQRDPESRLDAALAREVALRAGIKAVIAGDVNRVGGSYVLATRLIAAESGEELASLRETAADSTDIVAAIDRLSRKLRERLGESLRSLHANPPLADVTTGSLEALRKYSQGWAAVNAGEHAQGVALLEEAIALDSTFAMAWRKLATVTGGDRRVEAATRAYEHRERLTDRERYHTLGIYHLYVTGDEGQAITAYRTLLRDYPDDAVALNNLGFAYAERDELEQAAEMYRRAMAVDPLTARYPVNLIHISYGMGEPDTARAVLERFRANLPEHPDVANAAFGLETALRNHAAAEPFLAEKLASESPGQRELARRSAMHLALLRGRLGEAMALREELRGDVPDPIWDLMVAAEVDFRVRGDTAGAIRRGTAALARTPVESVVPMRWPMDDIMLVFADGGRLDIARDLADRWVAAMQAIDTTAARSGGEVLYRYLEAQELAQAGRRAAAVDSLRSALRAAAAANQCGELCMASLMGAAFDAAGQADSAIARYEAYLEVPDFDVLDEDASRLHHVYLRLARLYDRQGAFERARIYYARFIELWEEADSELQPRVEAARVRLAVILEEAG